MDDRRFDSLVKALAEGRSRRSVLKGLVGLGGAAFVGNTLRDDGVDAARRPTPTPTPVRCPGRQTWDPVTRQCVCPGDAPEECGSDCCTKGVVPVHNPGYSECCDQACCFGTCLPEEGCCPTNTRTGGLPPTHKICTGPNGPSCCEVDQQCCLRDGCCDTVCYGGSVGADFCCSLESFCPGGDTSEDKCCLNGTTCCGGGTDNNVCIDLNVPGNCCDQGDCDDPCTVCDRETHTCGPRCNGETEVCCTEQAGPGVCQLGTCCPGAPCEGGGCQECGVDPTTGVATCTDKCYPSICCTAGITDPADWFCAVGECCPSGQGCDVGEVCCGTGADAVCEQGPNCGCDSDRDCGVCETCNAGTCQPATPGDPCSGHTGDSDDTIGDGICCTDATGALICVLAETCTCDQFCGPVETGINTGSYYCCTEPDYTICCDGAESECCGGPSGRECQPNGHCCEAATPHYCPGDQTCCADPCNPLDGSCTPGGGCADTADCEACQVCQDGLCEPCQSVGQTCCTDGVCRVTCNEPTCAPNCDCADPANDGLGCNGGLAAGGGVCACGYCVVPLDGCPCGCAGDPECVQCDGNGGCVPINQNGSCNGGAGICAGEWCVDAPAVDCAAACLYRCDVIENGCDCGACPTGQFCMDSGWCCPGTSLGTNENCAYCGHVCGAGTTCQSNGSGGYTCAAPPECTDFCCSLQDCIDKGAGDDECTQCVGGACVGANQNGSCNGGAGSCNGVWCV